MPRHVMRSPLRHLDIEAVSSAARVESRNREIHLPPVSVYRWWARRTLAVNQAIIEGFERDHGAGPHLVVDPFAGGGVIPYAALSRGHNVYAQELNPWAAHGLAVSLTVPPAPELSAAVQEHAQALKPLLERAYLTVLANGEPALVCHTFRVGVSTCPNCEADNKHFPYAMVTLKQRKERKLSGCFLACPAGHLFESHNNTTTKCGECGRKVDPAAAYTSNREVRCSNCGSIYSLEEACSDQNWRWKVVLVEKVSVGEGRRELCLPTDDDIQQAEHGWCASRALGPITAGAETAVLLRHGFKAWEDLYPPRQREVLEALLMQIERCERPSLMAALRIAALGTAEMAGYVSRWDRWYLKSYESMAGHRFNFTTLTVEPNVWGALNAGRGTFCRRVALMCKASQWLRALPVLPKVQHSQRRVTHLKGSGTVMVVCGSSSSTKLAAGVVQLCLTDPPYHDDVQYSELSMPLRLWAGLGQKQLPGEAVVSSKSRLNTGKNEYRDLLESIFSEVHRILKEDGHLIFSYANRSPEAWADLLDALDAAKFRCVGFSIVHSENETDNAKRDVRACTLDLLIDVVPGGGGSIEKWSPSIKNPSVEQLFLKLVGKQLLQLGAFKRRWRENFIRTLRESEFLCQSTRKSSRSDQTAWTA